MAKYGRRVRAKSKTPKSEPVTDRTPVPKAKKFTLKKKSAEKITPDQTVSKRTWIRKKRRK